MWYALISLSLGIVALPLQGTEALTDLDLRILEEFHDVRETKRAIFHYRSSDVSAEQVDAAAEDVVTGFETLERALDMKYKGRIHVFLYKDHADLEARTGSGAVAFSCGTVSLHQPHDFRGVHELVHLFAVQFPRPRDAESDLFVVEGLATMLAESDQSVPIHSWAAVYASAGALPDLVALRRSFPEGAGPGVHPYHVAGSFVGFLIERFGMRKVKEWYVNSTEAYQAFGKAFRTLEREWREWLSAVKVEPAHRQHVLGRLGLSQEPIPEAYLQRKGVDLLASRDLRAFEAEDRTKWTFTDGILRGEHDGAWTRLHSKEAFGPRVGLRVKFRMLEGDAFLLRTNRAAGEVNEAIFARWSTYLSSGEGFTGNERVRVSSDVWNEAVFACEGGTTRLFLNGYLVLEAPLAPSELPGPVGLGVEKGRVEVASFEIFETS